MVFLQEIGDSQSHSLSTLVDPDTIISKVLDFRNFDMKILLHLELTW